MPGTLRTLTLSVSSLLLITYGSGSTAARTGWDCRPHPKGTGWECVPGEQVPPPPPAPQMAPPLEAEPPLGRKPTELETTPYEPPAPAVARPIDQEEEKEAPAEEKPSPPTEAETALPAPVPVVPPEKAEEEEQITAEPEMPAPEEPVAEPAAPTTEEDAPFIAEPLEQKQVPEDERLAVPAPDEPVAEPAAPMMEEAAPSIAEPLEEMQVPEDERLAAPEPDTKEAAVDLGMVGARIDEGLAWSYCGPPPTTRTESPTAAEDIDRDLMPIDITADDAQLEKESNTVLFTGNVMVDRGREHMEAHRVEFDKNSNQLKAEGDVFFQQQDLRITGSKAYMDLDAHTGEINDVEYRLIGVNARGMASQASIESKTRSRYQDISYTTCRPGKDDWQIEARELEIDAETGVGTARHAKLRLGGVPVMYTPYLTFPIDDRRKSGFLTPSFGNSDTRGVDIAVPYYFNIAPNMDATLTPRVMTKRGLMIGSEFRYLTENHYGEIRGEILPEDQDFDAGEDTRGAFSYQERGTLFGNWRNDININYVSDDRYLEDLGDSLSVSSARNLERRGDLTYEGNDWNFVARAQYFQTVDEAISREDRPYSRLPQLLLTMDKPDQIAGLRFGLETEYVYFDHDDAVRGHRVAIMPSVSLPMRRSYGFLIPKAILRYNQYDLTDTAPGIDDTPSFVIPTFSLDGGLVFDRPASWFGHASTQTLEPRLFYLLTSSEDQDEIPVFDTADYDFSFSSMFRDNRFSGRDRVGDANQITAALSSRFLAEETGEELFRVGVGQIFYFRKRGVQITKGTERKDSSALVAEIASRLSQNWSAKGAVQWNHQKSEDETEQSVVGVHYRTPDNTLLNLSYRFRREVFEDTDLSFRWPVSHRLHVVGRWNYSLRHERTVDSFGGIEYGKCCWLLRFVARHFANGHDDSNTSFMLQLELRGLGAIGDDIDKLLERDIYGYRTE